MKILHIVPGLNDGTNGIAVAAKLIASSQDAEIIDCNDFLKRKISNAKLQTYSEVWVHSNWLPAVFRACYRVICARFFNPEAIRTPDIRATYPKLVRMPHANLDTLRYHSKYWKKLLVSPIERWLYRHTDRVIVTCEAEQRWCEDWGLKNKFEIFDLRQFFKIGRDATVIPQGKALLPRDRSSLSVLYIGRQHPLKGVAYLERAIEGLPIELHIVSNKFGDELEKEWQWCDVFCLPTLSENFGLVIAEALERGKIVITTDGAPAWEPPKTEVGGRRLEVEQWRNHLVYLRGFRNGTDAQRVALLKAALREQVEG